MGLIKTPCVWEWPFHDSGIMKGKAFRRELEFKYFHISKPNTYENDKKYLLKFCHCAILSIL